MRPCAGGRRVQLEDADLDRAARPHRGAAPPPCWCRSAAPSRTGRTWCWASTTCACALLAERIAERLGNAVVAPVLAYVPEGAIEPPTQHMRSPARSRSRSRPSRRCSRRRRAACAAHGFRDVVLLGDHGGYQPSLERVAARLNREWAGGRARAACTRCGEYYRAAQQDLRRGAGGARLQRRRDRQPRRPGRHRADAGARRRRWCGREWLAARRRAPSGRRVGRPAPRQRRTRPAGRRPHRRRLGGGDP